MTTVIILMYGAGVILLISGFSTDPNTGDSPSIVNTLMEIWNGTPTKAASPPAQPGAGGAPQPIRPGGKGTGYRDAVSEHAATFWLQQRGY